MRQRLSERHITPSMLLGMTMLAFLIGIAIAAPLIGSTNPLATDSQPFTRPGPGHAMGTDYMGRDIWAMMVWGTRVALLFAVGAAGLSLIIGVFSGALSGYFGGILDDLLSRSFEVFIIIPRLFLIILVVALFGAKLWLAVLIIGLTLWPSNARVMRAQVLSLKSRGYVQAAQVSGGSDLQVLFEHIVPNGIAPVLANSTLQMAYAVILEAGLAFLGLSDPNVASWGQLLRAGQNYMTTAPWMVIFPGLAIAILLMSLHLIGGGLLGVLNPRLQHFDG